MVCFVGEEISPADLDSFVKWFVSVIEVETDSLKFLYIDLVYYKVNINR